MEMLVELDRLIQLIESPIFTCKYFHIRISFFYPKHHYREQIQGDSNGLLQSFYTTSIVICFFLMSVIRQQNIHTLALYLPGVHSLLIF
jgi:hypothetical protein